MCFDNFNEWEAGRRRKFVRIRADLWKRQA